MRRARELSAVPICALCWLHPGTALWRASGVWRLADEGCQPSTAEARARSSRCGAKHGHRSTFGSAPRTRHAVVCRGGPQPRACPCECDCRLVRSASSNFLGMHRAHTTQSSAGSAAVSSLARVVWCPCRREARGVCVDSSASSAAEREPSTGRPHRPGPPCLSRPRPHAGRRRVRTPVRSGVARLLALAVAHPGLPEPVPDR